MARLLEAGLIVLLLGVPLLALDSGLESGPVLADSQNGSPPHELGQGGQLSGAQAWDRYDSDDDDDDCDDCDDCDDDDDV